MAGKNQHYLPQFLTRRFALRVGQGKNAIYRAFVHHKDRGVSAPTNIATFGAQRNFYGKPGPGTLDDRMERRETDYGQLLVRTLEGKVLHPNDVPAVCSLVAHLIVRSKRIRAFAQEMHHQLAAFARRKAMDVPFLMQAFDQFDGDGLEQFLDRELETRGIQLTSDRRQELLRVARDRVEEQKRSSETIEGLGKPALALASILEEQAKTSAKLIQQKVLNEALDPEPRRLALGRLNWQLHGYGDEALILADAPVMAFGPSGGAQDALGGEIDPVCVALPIAPTWALIGFAEGVALPDAAALNLASTRFSSEFFIARSVTDQTRQLLMQLGTGPNPYDVALWEAEQLTSS
jgi:uncharacterized protein DUF4238